MDDEALKSLLKLITLQQPLYHAAQKMVHGQQLLGYEVKQVKEAYEGIKRFEAELRYRLELP